MVILSDWNQKHFAYKIPEELIEAINREVGSQAFKFSSDAHQKEEVKYYFGNIPDHKTLDTYPNLEWVHFGSIGIDKLPENFIKERCLTITNGAQTNTNAVITYCLGEIFKSCKAGFLSRNCDDKKELSRDFFNQFYENMIDYDDIEICIFGYGDIGKGLSELLSPIVKRINIVTRTKRKDFRNVHFYDLACLNNAINSTSHLINVLPLYNETRNLINLQAIGCLNGQYYICAGRAETHNLEDIVYFLEEGFLRGASLDVHGLKSGNIQESVKKLRNVQLTPHISGWTNKFWINQSKIILKNLAKANNNEFKDMINLKFLKGAKIL